MMTAEGRPAFEGLAASERGGLPILLDASVKEFSVEDLPDDGFPTRPMSGSRGIVPKILTRFEVMRQSRGLILRRKSLLQCVIATVRCM